MLTLPNLMCEMPDTPVVNTSAMCTPALARFLHGIGIRFGDFYAKRLVEALGLQSYGGVVRVSMAHYNTVDEIDRLGLAERIRAPFDEVSMIPAAGQGALGIEVRSDATSLRAQLGEMVHAPTWLSVHAERAVSRALGGSCSMPLAAHAVWRGDQLHIDAALGHGAEPTQPLLRASRRPRPGFEVPLYAPPVGVRASAEQPWYSRKDIDSLPEAQAAAAAMLDLARERPSALLCYERDPEHCHRTLLLDAVGEGVRVVDLFA